jgi:hypothetical protein
MIWVSVKYKFSIGERGNSNCTKIFWWQTIGGFENLFLNVFQNNAVKKISFAASLRDSELIIWLNAFYLPHMEYEGSIGLVTGKIKIFYCFTFYG